MTTPSMTKNAAPQQQGNTGSSRLNALIQALETVQIENQYDLHEFCEALRGLGHRLAVETMMGSHELEAGLKEQAKADATLGIPGFDSRRAIRGTIRQFKSCADHFASAAGCAAAGWTSFEKNFDQALSRKPKAAKRGGFKIEG
jgi:hypothetical protein